MTILDTLKSLVTTAKAATEKIQEAMGKLVAKREALLREEQELFSRPAPRAELAGNIRRLVEETRQRWIAANGLELVQRLSGRIDRAMGPPDARRPDQVVSPSLPMYLQGGYLTFDILAALVPTMLIDGLAAAVDAVDYEAGLAMGSRLSRLMEITADLGRLEHEQTELVDATRESGIASLQLPPEVAAARQRAGEKHAAWERDIAINRKIYERHPEMRPPEPPQ